MTYVPNLRNLVKSSSELHEPEVSDIKGRLPSWMKGTYIRNGPGKWDLSSEFYLNHVFDGFAILTRFAIDSDKVAMSSRYLISEDYTKALRVGRPVHLGFGTRSYADPNKSLLSRFVSNITPQETSDNCCTGIYRIGSDLFTGVDGTYFYQVDPTTLKTKEKLDGNKLFGLNVISPKPVRDPGSGDIYNVGSFVSASGVKHGVMRIPNPDKFPSSKDAFKKAKLVASWPSRWPTSCHYTHSFGVTKNYFVVIDQPLLAGLTALATNSVKGKSMIELFQWHPSEKNRFFLLDRMSGKLLKTEYISSETFFFFHIINCFEDNNHMIVDIMAYEDTSHFQSMFIERLREDFIEDTKPCQARRYVFPISDDVKQFQDDGRNLNEYDQSLNNSNSKPNNSNNNCESSAKAVRDGNQIIVHPSLLTQTSAVEGPTINRKFIGRKYKYFYGNPSFHFNFMNCLGKFNTETQEQMLWRGIQFEHPGEPVFVPNPNNPTAEDDGVIISAITDVRPSHPSFLLFLDAKTMEELARVEFNTRIPLSVDGLFIPSSDSAVNGTSTK